MVSASSLLAPLLASTLAQWCTGTQLSKAKLEERIPPYVFVTGPYHYGRPEFTQAVQNIAQGGVNFQELEHVTEPRDSSIGVKLYELEHVTELRDSSIGDVRHHSEKSRIVEELLGPRAPKGAEIFYYTDEMIENSARQIAGEIEASQGWAPGRLSSAYNLLRPYAYKVDLWRCMVLWSFGGIYVDVNIRLMKNLSSFIDLENDKLWLIKDVGPGRYWQAMMAARRRHPQLLVALKGFTDSIHNRSYGENNLDITGPQALYRHLHKDPQVEDKITVKYELREEISNACGGLREENKPPCPVKVWPVNVTDPNEAVAMKDLGLHSQAWQHSNVHYIGRYLNRSVYCDEPGPPCA